MLLPGLPTFMPLAAPSLAFLFQTQARRGPLEKKVGLSSVSVHVRSNQLPAGRAEEDSVACPGPLEPGGWPRWAARAGRCSLSQSPEGLQCRRLDPFCWPGAMLKVSLLFGEGVRWPSVVLSVTWGTPQGDGGGQESSSVELGS